MAKRDPKIDTSDFPPYNVPPSKRILRACEALCWIGYKRAIPQELYFRAIPEPWPGAAQAEATLHEAIPGPKPIGSPLDDAARQLMRELRKGSVRALIYRTMMDAPKVLEPPDFDLALTISARGELCADETASAEDRDEANKVRKSGLRFLTDEIVHQWPPIGAKSNHKLSSRAAPPAIPTLLQDHVLTRPLTTSRRRGPRPEKRDAVVRLMLKDYSGDRSRLDSEKEESLALNYKCSRDTCRAARIIALDKLPQTPTIDK